MENLSIERIVHVTGHVVIEDHWFVARLVV